MGRYKLTDEKRAEMTRTINTESKRLANMIQTFLSVERLSEAKCSSSASRSPHRSAHDLRRSRPPTRRTQANLYRRTPSGRRPTHGRPRANGVRRLQSPYHAIKYSPAGTHVAVTTEFDGKNLRLSVRDQGMGMDEQELASIFRKFYRTRKAEASGEVGTGIGLSIVDQIVNQPRRPYGSDQRAGSRVLFYYGVTGNRSRRWA
jgi:signal transduction histidine kinase